MLIEHERKQINYSLIGNLRIDHLFVWWEKWVVEKPVNPMDGLRAVECVGNRHDNIGPSFYFVYIY